MSNSNNSTTGKLTIGNALFMAFAVAIYSSSGFFTKLASQYEFLSTTYILCLCGVVVVLGTYAILWQIALKRVNLNQAYLFRSLGLIYGLCIAYFAFHEFISWQNLLGALIVLTGLLILLSEK